MKIEMGESLFYSWLRHVKECQVVQTNWKVSPQWTLQHEDALQALMAATDEHFFSRYGYRIYKNNRSLSQLLRQGECDVLGLSMQHGPAPCVYAVDVAFHEAGLNYGTREVTVMKVLEKCLRTAMCLYGYLGVAAAEIVFASPKINNAELTDLTPCVNDANALLSAHGLDHRVRILANEAFDSHVLRPILTVSDGVSDTSELFLRSYQMYRMFSEKAPRSGRAPQAPAPGEEPDAYQELKIGKLAQVMLRRLLEEGRACEDEIRSMQEAQYSKQYFGLNYPLLAKEGSEFEALRYYSQPLTVRGQRYYLCSQWFETAANNDRPCLLRWIRAHDTGRA